MEEYSKRQIAQMANLTKSRNRRGNFRSAKSVDPKRAFAARQMRRNFGGAFGKEKAEVASLAAFGTGTL